MADYDAGILVVDDERFFREAIAEILSNEGLSCVMAETGEEALDRVADGSLGVVVLDIRLPDIDGIQVLARLREIRPSLRVIMLSASTDQDLVLEALRLGACDYLAKPIHDEELVLAVRRALESYSQNADWTWLRTRLDLMVALMEELVGRLTDTTSEERRWELQRGVVEVVSEVLEASKTSLMLQGDSDDRLRVVAVHGRGFGPDDMDSEAPGEGVAGMALQRREPVLVQDVESDPLFSGFTHTERYETNSFAVAPVMARGEPIGVLCATDRKSKGEFTSDDLSLLRMLAMQLGELLSFEARSETDQRIAEQITGAAYAETQILDGVPKSSEEEEFERDSELGRQVCQAVIDEVEPARVIAAALRPLTHLLPAAPVSLFLIDATSGELVKEGECDGGVCGDRDELNRTGLTGAVVQTGNMVATQDPAADSRFDSEVDTPMNGQVRPFLCVPLRLKGKVVGVFRAFLHESGEASARTGEVLAAALSAAIRNVLLYRSLVETIEEVAQARRAARG